MFSLGQTWWAWPSSMASHFFSLDYILPLPIKDKNIVGLSYHQGNIITVLRTDKVLRLDMGKHPDYKQALAFVFRGEYYAWLVEQGGETVQAKAILTDKNKKNFNKYFIFNKNKIYCLEPEDLMGSLKLYD